MRVAAVVRTPQAPDNIAIAVALVAVAVVVVVES